jgi:anti-sigma-K factor RskA
MIPDDIQALALADAIGALDGKERRELAVRRAALPRDVRAEVAHLYDAIVEIAVSVPGEAPSPCVRDELLEKIAASRRATVVDISPPPYLRGS